MTRRTKRWLVIGGIAIIVFLIAWFLYRTFFAPEPMPTNEPQQTEIQEQKTLPQEDDTAPTLSDQRQQAAQEERNQTASIQSLTKTFVQRYGSYSNESDFANLEDVVPLMTDRFAAETRAYIDSTESPEEYYGVTTQVVSISVESRDEAAGTATVRVTTQREEAAGSPQNTSVRYQDILLNFERVNGTWKVDDATWQ